MRITINLVADMLELRCEACKQLLETIANKRDSYFRAGDFMDHVCAVPIHDAAQKRINPQIGR